MISTSYESSESIRSRDPKKLYKNPQPVPTFYFSLYPYTFRITSDLNPVSVTRESVRTLWGGVKGSNGGTSRVTYTQHKHYLHQLGVNDGGGVEDPTDISHFGPRRCLDPGVGTGVLRTFKDLTKELDTKILWRVSWWTSHYHLTIETSYLFL